MIVYILEYFLSARRPKKQFKLCFHFEFDYNSKSNVCVKQFFVKYS